MKAMKLFLIVLVPFFFGGCEKDEDEPVLPVIPTCDVSCSSTSIDKGDSVFFKWTSTVFEKAELRINNEPVSIEPIGSRWFTLFAPASFEFIFSNVEATSSAVQKRIFQVNVSEDTVIIPLDPPVVELSTVDFEVEYAGWAVIYVQTSKGVRFESNIPDFSGITGPYEVGPLVETTTFYVKAFNEKEESTIDSLTIFVVNIPDFNRNDTLLADYGPWIPVYKECMILPDTNYFWYGIPTCVLDNQLFYSYIPKRQIKTIFGQKCYPEEPDQISDEYFWTGDMEYNNDVKIELLTTDSLVISYPTGEGRIRETYVHP